MLSAHHNGAGMLCVVPAGRGQTDGDPPISSSHTWVQPRQQEALCAYVLKTPDHMSNSIHFPHLQNGSLWLPLSQRMGTNRPWKEDRKPPEVGSGLFKMP